MSRYPYNINLAPICISSHDPIIKISRVTDLMKAVLLNNDITPYLHEINERIDGWSALTIAVLNSVTWSSENTVEQLLAANANTEFQAPLYASTALTLAICYSTKNTINNLINAGANMNCRDHFGWTPLILASQCDKYDMIEILINKGCNVNLLDNYGKSALSWIAYYTHANSKPATRLFINAGANIEFQDLEFKYTPLLVILAHSNCDKYYNISKMLINAGSNLELRDWKQRTALILAIQNKHKKTCAMIINQITQLQSFVEINPI